MAPSIFLFPGLGSQWCGMGRSLLDHDAAFAATVAEYDRLFAAVGAPCPGELLRHASAEELDCSEHAHLTTFAYQVALTHSLASRGLVPAAVIGHSSGEVAAAVCAGILTPPAAVTLVLAHLTLIRAVDGAGAMLHAALPHDAARQLATTHAGIEIAACNGAAAVVFGGPEPRLAELAGELNRRRIFCRPLKTSIAFHTSLLDPHLGAFRSALASLAAAPARCPYYSALDGGRYDGPWDADYWSRHIRRPILFSQAVDRLLAEHGAIDLLEIAPHPLLTPVLCADHADRHPQLRFFAPLERDCDEVERLATLPGELALAPTGTTDNGTWKVLNEEILRDEVERLPGAPHPFAADKSWFDLGLTSLQLLLLSRRLGERLGRKLSPEPFFRHPLPHDFIRAFNNSGEVPRPAIAGPAAPATPVAIIGMAFRFPPDLDSPQRLADFLRRDESAVSPAADDRPGLSGEVAAFLQPAPLGFDARYFNISAAEAAALDPQQRLLLEVSCHALEEAGIAGGALRGSNTGVFLGISTDDFKELSQQAPATSPYAATGAMFNTASGRLSYFHDLRGPAISVDTACSSSLVALHLASRALRQGECDLALAGGVNLILSRRLFDAMRALGALSPSGNCHSFAAAADGYARGEGCALLVLKRLDDALAAGDRILATIRGSAVNQDGRSNGLTAPSSAAQGELLHRALSDAALGVDDIGFIESHGTGTPLGDPIEISALGEVLASRSSQLPPVLLGALKSRLGHLEACAGVAGVVTAILALQRGELPGILHFTPSAHIDWQGLPLAAAAHPAPLGTRSRIAGVSAFGFSGTNAHLLLAAPPSPEVDQGIPVALPCLFAISAKSATSLRQLAQRYLEQLDGDRLATDHHLSRAQLTTRDPHPYRFAMVVGERDGLMARLRELVQGEGIRRQPQRRGKLAMLLPGQGTQYVGMGEELYRFYPVFRAAVDDCAARCAARGFPILATLYPEDRTAPSSIDSSPLAQLSYFAFAWGAFALWRSFGVTPDYLLGHSLGEYVAAALAEVISLDDAITLIVKRGELTAELPGNGRMATVMAPREEVARLLCDFPALDIAVINGPNHMVVAGEEEGLNAFCHRASAQGLDTRPLSIHFASHCRLVEPILDRFAACCAAIAHHPPRIAVITNLTGAPLATDQTFGAEYWREHLRQPVDFSHCLWTALNLGVTDFIELGPSSVLTSIVRAGSTAGELGLMTTASYRRPTLHVLFESLQELYLRGIPLDWAQVFAPSPPRWTALPLYPFDHQPFPLPEGAPTMTMTPVASAAGHPQPTPAATAPLAALQRLVQRISWKEPAELDPAVNLFTLGLDSLMLVQIRQQIDKEFAVNIPLGAFYEEFDTLGKIAAHLAGARPSQTEPSTPAAPLCPPAALPAVTAISGVPELFARQLEALRELCHRQIELLGQGQRSLSTTPAAEGGDAAATPRFNFRSMRLSEDRLDGEQRAFIAALASRLNRKTAASKAQATRYRRVLADWINSLGYKQSLKELVYPIVAARSQGAHFVDIDGNDYIDLAMGYGVTFLGHRPATVIEAMRRQLDDGFELGPQSRLAGEVAELVSELTGVERVAFCNTGSEAVMVALRLARAVTGRERVILFGNSYHGTFDGVLATAIDGTTYPTAAGIPRKMVADVTILTYGAAETLEQIRAYGNELAAVLVEPVQSRNPALVPVEFLRELRDITRAHGIALIFDETITGFRMHPGGAQALFGIRADLVVYGKAVGGGMPLSLVAGSARFLDAIDGGDWSYGDDSHPSDNLTFFGGTYVKHPLALAAAKAALTMLKEEGPALQRRTGELLDDLAQRVNAFFSAAEVPLKLVHFGSMFRFEGSGRYSLALDPIEVDLFFHLLMERGIYTWERRICFLSSAHTPADIDQVVAAVEASVASLRSGGFSFRSARNGDIAHPARAAGTSAPLTSAQLRLLVYDQLSTEKTLYNLPLAYLFTGEIERSRLEAALAAVVARHPALTARFFFDREQPRQEFPSDRSLALEYCDATGQSVAEVMAAAVRPFALGDELLLRAALYRRDAAQYLFVCDFHHLVADGLALNVFVQEVMAAYAGTPLPPPGPHYVDFVTAEQAYRESPAYGTDEAFWRATFADPPPPLALAGDFPRPAEQDHRGDNVFFTIAAATTTSLKQLAGRNGVSLFSLLLAAYAALLERLTGEERITVGIPVDARPDGFTHSVGMFASTLALPLTIDRQLPFIDLARQVQKTFLRAYEHQRYPFDDLLRLLGTTRDLGRNPLFDTMFIFENGQDRIISLPGLVCSPCTYNKPTAMFDLTCEVIEADGELHYRLEYATSLFRRTSIERLAARLKRLLAVVAATPTTVVSTVDLLEDDEQTRLAALNRTARPFADDATIPALWARRLAQDPERIALHFAGHDYSRRWLDERANRIAHTITTRIAPQPDERVALLMERSAWAVAALLGILKAGAAYVPIAPDFPAERRSAILAGSGARALLVSRQEHDTWCQECGVPIILVEDGGGESVPPGAPGLAAGHLAYIMFTSGSTGAPKGVMISHRNVVAMTENLPHVYGIDEGDTLLAVTTFTFDISVLEIICALLVGTRIVLASDDDNQAITPLAELINTHRVTAFQTTPSRLKLMLELSGDAAVLGQLHTLLIGGEAFPADLFARLRHATPRIFNVYGPTETTIWSTSTLINGTEQPTIGRPLCNEQVYILDRALRAVPPGSVGELYIGGAGVGRGYLGMPELTARKFIPVPWGVGDERLYATGDLARLRDDDTVEFLGRSDDQIKLRGYRIELQEIENRLVTHPALLQAAVKPLRDPNSGEIRDLAAYYTLRSDLAPPSVEALRDHLGQWLPGYMLPAYYHQLEKMPLNPSGKIDRKALPAGRPPTAVTPPATGAADGPLATIMAGVLGVAELGADDNFFACGGDSIRAILVVARAREAGFPLEVRHIFATPTLRQLTALLPDAAVVPSAPTTATVTPLLADQRLPLTPMQEGMLFHSLLDNGSEAYINQATFSVGCDLDAARCAAVWQELTERHAMLRTRFVTRHTAEPYQVVLPRYRADLRCRNLSSLPAAEQDAVLAAVQVEERRRQAHLDTAPPLSLVLLQRAPCEWQVVWTFHHILFDGWSIAVLLREFVARYRGEELATPLADFPDYLAWLVARDQNEALRFWQQHLATAPFTPLVATSSTDGEYQRGEVTAALGAPTFARLGDIAGQHGLTVNALLQSAWALALHGATGQRDLLFGATIAGRPAELAGVADMVGLFINTLPVRATLTTTTTVLELAHALQNASLAAIPHQHLGLAQLQAAVGHPLFDHILIFENYPLSTGVRELFGTATAAVTDVTFFEHSHYPLEVMLMPGTKLDITCRFNRSLLAESQVSDLAQRFCTILSRCAISAGLSLAELCAPPPPPGVVTSHAVIPPAAATGAGVEEGRSEDRLCTLFARVLELPQVNDDDHFFTCGGHSLKVVRLAGLIWLELGLEVPLRLIYQHPTPRTLAAALTTLKTAPGLELTAGADAADHPLSKGQTGLWLVQQLQPTSCAYNTVGSYRLTGPLDIPALESAFNTVAQRHEALRTWFDTKDGEPCQRIAATATPLLTTVDLRHVDDGERTARAAIMQQLLTPFDLRQLPLCRITLFVLGDGHHILSLIFHHIVSDGWSDALLAREISHFYRAARGTERGDLPTPTVQYRDFAHAQQRYLHGEGSRSSRRFWCENLGGERIIHDVYPDYPRPALRAGRGARHGFELATVAHGLRDLASTKGVTPFVILQALVKLLIYAVTGANDVIIGVPSANRSNPASHDVVGYFLNLLPIRSLLVAEAPFTHFVDDVQRATLAAFEHQDYPFGAMVEDLNLPHSLNRHPLFDVMMIMHNHEPPGFDFDAVVCTPFFADSATCRFDLDIEIFDDAAFSGFIEYDCELYRPETVAWLSTALNELASAVVVAPATPLGELAARFGHSMQSDDSEFLAQSNLIGEDI